MPEFRSRGSCRPAPSPSAWYFPSPSIARLAAWPPWRHSDIEVLELTLDEALAMVGDGRIVDAQTIMLLQHAELNGPMVLSGLSGGP